MSRSGSILYKRQVASTSLNLPEDELALVTIENFRCGICIGEILVEDICDLSNPPRHLDDENRALDAEYTGFARIPFVSNRLANLNCADDKHFFHKTALSILRTQ